MNITRQSITRITTKHLVVRIWRDEPLEKKVDNHPMRTEVRMLSEILSTDKLILARRIAADFDRVTKVEVLDKHHRSGEIVQVIL